MTKKRIPNARTTSVPGPRTLQGMLEQAQFTREQAAAHLGVSLRTLERYLAPSCEQRMPFPLFFTFTALCYGTGTRERTR